MLELTFCIEISHIFYLLPVTTVFTLFRLALNLTSVRNKDSSCQLVWTSVTNIQIFASETLNIKMALWRAPFVQSCKTIRQNSGIRSALIKYSQRSISTTVTRGSTSSPHTYRHELRNKKTPSTALSSPQGKYL